MADSNTIEILRRARERLSSSERWCKGRSARTASGDPCLPDDPEAASWCVEGAVLVEARLHSPGMVYIAALPVRTALKEAAMVMGAGRCPPREINDMRSTTHADLLALVDQAIEAEEARR